MTPSLRCRPPVKRKNGFDKWFKNPIPPKNLNMNFELSDEMKALFKEPNDKALN